MSMHYSGVTAGLGSLRNTLDEFEGVDVSSTQGQCNDPDLPRRFHFEYSVEFFVDPTTTGEETLGVILCAMGECDPDNIELGVHDLGDDDVPCVCYSLRGYKHAPPPEVLALEIKRKRIVIAKKRALNQGVTT